MRGGCKKHRVSWVSLKGPNHQERVVCWLAEAVKKVYQNQPPPRKNWQKAYCLTWTKLQHRGPWFQLLLCVTVDLNGLITHLILLIWFDMIIICSPTLKRITWLRKSIILIMTYLLLMTFLTGWKFFHQWELFRSQGGLSWRINLIPWKYFG